MKFKPCIRCGCRMCRRGWPSWKRRHKRASGLVSNGKFRRDGKGLERLSLNELEDFIHKIYSEPYTD